ncbi:PIR protein [Plasmodium vivax]|nr:PIR protein [Plasmodium vivax]
MAGQDILTQLSSLFFSFSNELNSQYFYNQLEDIEDFKEYFPNCKSLRSFPNSRSVIRICAKLLKYLESNTINKNDEYDVCKLLNFWVYRWLFDILGTNDEKYIPLVYGQLQLIWSFFIQDKPENKTCVPISELVLHDDWRNRKELYEYCVDYYTFSKTLVGYPERCKEFYKYVESKKTLYKYFNERCTTNNTNRCPDFYDQCKQYDPEKVLRDLHCNDGIRQESDTASFRVPRIRSGDSVNEPDSEEGNVGMMPVGPSNLNGNPKTVENVGNILLGVVATTMTSGALYRFTPLGGMIRNGLGWNNNNMRNFNGGDIRLYDYASDSFNPYPGEEHYIGYHPA